VGGVAQFLLHIGIVCVGLDETGYRTRFCYEDKRTALFALLTWDGRGDPPGPWIKEKGRVERNNPATFKGIPIETECSPSRDPNLSTGSSLSDLPDEH